MKKQKLTKAKKIMIAINILAFLFVVSVLVFLCFKFSDIIKLLGSKDGQNQLIDRLHNTGVAGVFILLTIQILQIIVAFIPGEIVELVSGAMFGAWWGLVLCLAGLIIATYIIYWLVKWLGNSFSMLNVDEKKSTKFNFLKGNPDRALIILFFFFLVPGVPKDFIIYLIPFTKIKINKFVIVSSIARIPSIISSTIVGAAIVEKNFLAAGIVMGIIAVLSILGIIFNKKIYEFIMKFKEKRNRKVEETTDEVKHN